MQCVSPETPLPSPGSALLLPRHQPASRTVPRRRAAAPLCCYPLGLDSNPGSTRVRSFTPSLGPWIYGSSSMWTAPLLLLRLLALVGPLRAQDDATVTVPQDCSLGCIQQVGTAPTCARVCIGCFCCVSRGIFPGTLLLSFFCLSFSCFSNAPFTMN